MYIEQIIKPAVLISEKDTLRTAISKMVSDQTNTLLVVDADGKLVGEIHITDILDAIVPEYLDGDSIAAHFASREMFEEAVSDAGDVEISLFMTTDSPTVTPEEGLMAVAAIAIARKKTHIPVVDQDQRPIGMISRRGIKHLIADALNIPDQQ